MGLVSKWTDGEREAPEPLEGPVLATVIVGTALWTLLFLGQLPFYGWYADRGHAWWIWTCAAGAGLGLIGLWYVRRREAATGPPDTPDASPGDASPRDISASDPAGGSAAAEPTD